MVNKNFEKLAFKIESVFSLICIYSFGTKLLDYAKQTLENNPNLFNKIVLYIAIGIALVFFCATWSKTHRIALHTISLYTCVCLYMQRETIMATFGFIILGLFMIGLVAYNMYHSKKYNTSSEDSDFGDAFVSIFSLMMLAIMQLAFAINLKCGLL